MALAQPFFGTGGITVYAAVALVGARFIKSHSTQGNGNLGAQPCGAGQRSMGVAFADVAQGSSGLAYTEPGAFLPVTCAENLSAGDEVSSDSVGRAVKTSSVAGASATAATVDTGVVGSNTGLTWTARDAGAAGNGISIQYLGSTGNNVSLSVAVNGNDIVVTPATNGSGVITSTAADVDAAIAASAGANALVIVGNTGASSGAGVIAAMAATSLAGGTDASSTAVVAGVCREDATSGALATIELV